jgi:nucleoside-diphosphate-sugar epimerase
MQKVFVTGITGKSGLFFLKEIANAAKDGNSQYDYTFLVRSEERAQLVRGIYPEAKVFIADIEESDKIREHLLVNSYDIVFHIAGIGVSSQFVEQVVQSPTVRWLILVHTTGIYSRYKSAGEFYRQTEQHISELIADKNIATTILRPTMIYGNMNDHNISVFVKMVDKLRIFPVVNHAKYELQPVWCGDLGKAYHHVLMHANATRGQNYNLSGGAPIMLIDVFRTIAKQLGVQNRFVNVPFSVAYSGACMLYLLTLGKIDFRERVQRLVEPRTFYHSEASKDFGYSPVDFPTGIAHQIAEYQASKK